ncbi:YifB family Mg chelatase-like AAA ATPase [Dokdonella sp.]|uniref:YifB family Mg chelatase-like AAA ATPase n=1 Tax=Dokdonella sp. TaxID=2291710 RepID=UPI0025BC1D0F|nr:YifB family Mg chelatase-like AAA ATPase [Dokdonella sp.]MBX3687968.1 YifB family Mg chelatase-like AAA ATPase [Dokdonella sp.]
MSLAVVYTRAQSGVAAPLVACEVHLSGGLPGTSIVGLPETAVKEARDRVRAAILNAQLEYPQRRVTVNLAPADLPKDGGRYDLPIALGILAANGSLPQQVLGEHEFVGELALSGELRAVNGVLPAVLHAARSGRRVIVPRGNAAEASLVRNAQVLVADNLLAVCAHLAGRAQLDRADSVVTAPAVVAAMPDLAEVRGQPQARRALEIAAAGSHNLLLCGPPGTGKTMLASRLPGILPPLEEDEALELAAVRSVAGQASDPSAWKRRAFRHPHHTASAVALVGGGSIPRPGEISLAHHGVLFLDELPEFDRHVLEVLREPLESGQISISRAARQVDFPARFQLIVAMNPCPCGHAGDASDRCRCSAEAIARYRARISGPLLDRIDLKLEMPRVSHLQLREAASGESSATVRERVVTARARQLARSGTANAWLGNRELERCCALADSEQALLDRAFERLGLSARAYHRVLRVARTIADLAGQTDIGAGHLAEAIQYQRQAFEAPPLRT